MCLKVLAAFVIGMITALTGAMIYSRAEQSRGSFIGPTAIVSVPILTSSQHIAPNRADLLDDAPRATSHITPDLLNKVHSYPRPQQSGPGLRLPDEPRTALVRQAPVVTQANDHNGAVEQQEAAAVPPETHARTIPSQQAPKVATLQPTTGVNIRLTETLSSDHNRTGDTFRAALAVPLVVNGFVVAEADSAVLGRIASARKAPFRGGRADLTLTLTEITTTGGRVVGIETGNVEREGSRSGFVNTAKMTAGAAVGAVFGAVTGAVEGAGIGSASRTGNRKNGFTATKRSAVFPAGTQMTFRLTSPVGITE